jgi:hypothetical protein
MDYLPRSLFVLGLLALIACGGANPPRVKVLGVADSQSRAAPPGKQAMRVFIEVINPTKLDLKLSRLEYRLDAESWFRVDGEVVLSRSIQAGSAAVIELPVQLSRVATGEGVGGVNNPVPYSLAGRLFAVTDRAERAWNIEIRGLLSPDAVADARRGPRMRIASPSVNDN